jgi:hypothetical protein
MVRIFRTQPRRRLSLPKRDVFGMSEGHIFHLRQILKMTRLFVVIRKVLIRNGRYYDTNKFKMKRLQQYIAKLLRDSISYEMDDHEFEIMVQRPIKPPRNESAYDFSRIGFSEKFRFRSPEDIVKLVQGLQIPDTGTTHGCKFSSHEIVLVSLCRLAYPLRWTDVMAFFPGLSRIQCIRAFYWFVNYMIENWGYLILNNREFWRPYLQSSAQAIRDKLQVLPRENTRLFFNNPNEEMGFNVFGFIDNTLLAMCRPGGGGNEGENAPRITQDIQRAWWTGWKKIHGLKWQSVILANGMDFEVWGPVSVRHPDTYTILESKIKISWKN